MGCMCIFVCVVPCRISIFRFSMFMDEIFPLTCSYTANFFGVLL